MRVDILPGLVDADDLVIFNPAVAVLQGRQQYFFDLCPDFTGGAGRSDEIPPDPTAAATDDLRRVGASDARCFRPSDCYGEGAKGVIARPRSLS